MASKAKTHVTKSFVVDRKHLKHIEAEAKAAGRCSLSAALRQIIERDMARGK